MGLNYSLFVPGEPFPQPRVKAAIAGKHARVYTPTTGKAWREALVRSLELAPPRALLKGPLDVELFFYIKRPKSHKPNSHPIGARSGDLDNYAKSVLDAMQDRVYTNDSQVVKLLVVKTYANNPSNFGAYMVVSECLS